MPRRSRLVPLLYIAAFLAACGTAPTSVVEPTTPGVELESAIYLIGDAGTPYADIDPVITALKSDIESLPSGVERTVIFLGDNAYPQGLTDVRRPDVSRADQAENERRLLGQVRVATETSTPTIFIPGNHDWGDEGSNALIREAEFVERVGNGWVDFLPDPGCPGPAVRDLGSRIRLILIDTEWWLRQNGGSSRPMCENDSPTEILDAIGAVIDGAEERDVILAGHHPLATGSAHGGYFRLREHLFPLRDWKSWAWIPLPVIGSVYPFARNRGITDQDLSGDLNRAMRRAIDSTLAAHPVLAYVSGHVHGLEVLDAGQRARALIVSGAGSYAHTDPVRWTDATRFAAPGHSGYAKLEFDRSGRVRLIVVTVDSAGARTVAYSVFLEDQP